MKIPALALALALAAPAFAQEKDTRTPIERYRGDSAFALMSCGLKLRLAEARAASGKEAGEDADVPACIVEGKAKGKAGLDAAMKAARKPAAREALKGYHVAFVSALEGVIPGADEARISYAARQRALNDRVTAAWARFEVEQ